MTTTIEYLLGHSYSERERLLGQAALMDQEARWLLDRLDVRPGWRAIDVACGPLGILPLLAERVGPAGEVVGLDREPEMLAHAEEMLARRDLHNVRLVHADATATGLPRAGFDLAHVRLLLVNVPNPADVLAELVALVRPGGVVAVQEVDWISWQCQPGHPAWDRLRDIMRQAWQAHGLDPFVGRRLPEMLRDAGLVDVEATAHAGIDPSGHFYQRLLLTFVDRFRPRILDGGFATAAHLEGLTAALRRHLDDPGTLVVRALSVQAWGRVPAP